MCVHVFTFIFFEYRYTHIILHQLPTITHHKLSQDHPVSMANASLYAFRTKAIMILMVAATGWGVNPNHIIFPSDWHDQSFLTEAIFDPSLIF